MCLGIYISVYAFITLFVVLGFNDHLMDSGLLAFTTVFSQAVALIAATGITGLLSGVEIDRVGLGAVFNVLSEIITKARNFHQKTHSGKDA